VPYAKRRGRCVRLRSQRPGQDFVLWEIKKFVGESGNENLGTLYKLLNSKHFKPAFISIILDTIL